MTDQVVNLIDDPRVTVTLIADPLSWRVRVVEEIVVDSATSCTRRRSLQVAPLRPVLKALVPKKATHALLALNVAPTPRGPLLDFNVNGPFGDGWLLPRVEIAAREAAYLEGIARLNGQVISRQLRRLLEAILGFTGDDWFPTKVPSNLAPYLRDGIGLDISGQALKAWGGIDDRCRVILRPWLDQFQRYSAPETPALGLPTLFAEQVLTTEEEATAVLAEYLDLLMQMHRIKERDPSSTAWDFLQSLADYANSYDLIVSMKVPLDEPFLVKTSDRRDLKMTRFSNRGRQDVVIADAQTNHVTFRVADPNVRIKRFDKRTVDGTADAFGAFQSRKDEQSRAIYAHDADRDYRMRAEFTLALLRRLQLVPWLIVTLLLLLTVAMWVSQPTALSTLAVIVGPSAIAASLLLVREPTSLGSRLRLTNTIAIFAALVALIGTATLLYLKGLCVLPFG